MDRQARNELRGVVGKRQRNDSRADDALAEVATAGDEGQGIVMKGARPYESAAAAREIHAELGAADAGAPGHQSAWDHGQQQGAAGVIGRIPEGAEDTGADDHGGGEQSGRQSANPAHGRSLGRFFGLLAALAFSPSRHLYFPRAARFLVRPS